MTRKLLTMLFALSCGLALPAAGQEQKGETVRPEVGKPLQAAIELLKAKKGKEALARAREAQAVPKQTPYETYLVTRIVAQSAAAAGEASTAAGAFEQAAASAAAPAGEKVQFLAAAASQYYVAKEYAKAAEVAQRYFKQGGTDKAVRTLYVQSLYLGNNYPAAAKEILADIEAEEAAKRKPSEEQLQLLANAYLQGKDNAGYLRATEKLAAYYPKRDYWLTLLHGVATRPGFSERLALDVARLKMETGTMRTPNDYLDAAQLALIDGFPAEATKIIDKGYAEGVLGKGQDAERHKRLKELAAKNLAEDKKTLAQEEGKDTAAKDGRAIFNEGFNLVFHGKAAKGLEMMHDGLKRGTGAAKRVDHARLQLAYAYHVAGQNERAIQQFKGVQGTDGAAALARLWVIRLSRGA